MRPAPRHTLEAWHAESVVGDVELIAVELVTNALAPPESGALVGLELLPGARRLVRLVAQDRANPGPSGHIQPARAHPGPSPGTRARPAASQPVRRLRTGW